MDRNQLAKIIFKYKAHTSPGEQVIVVGENASLGFWDPKQGASLSTDSGSFPIWSSAAPINLPLDSVIEYKYVIVSQDTVKWESLPGNRKVTVSDKEMIIEDEENTLISRHIITQHEQPSSKGLNYQSPSIQFDIDVEFQSSDSLIIVSMNLPIKVIRNPDYNSAVPSSQKWLFTSYQGLWMPVLYNLARSEGIKFKWVGWPHILIENEAEQEELAEILLNEYNCVPLFIPEDILTRHNHFCNNVLFPLFNNIIETAPDSVPQYGRELWEAYRNVNSRFADKVMEIYTNELIWIHDYQLLLTPSFVSRRTRDVLNIGLYLHIPFPSSEVYRVLPHREALLHGMLCCDLIGFHLFEYARHFITGCKRLLGVDHQFSKGGYLVLNYYGRHIMLRIGHVGVDPALINSIKAGSEYNDNLVDLRKKYEGKKVILGIDAMNRLSGINLKFNAFRNVMQNLQKMKDEIVLVQICTPAKNTTLHDVEKERSELYDLKDAINAEIGARVIEIIEADMSPDVRYAYMAISMGVVVSTIRDGLCLIPFEYLAINQEREAHIVVSEFAGVSRALSSPTRINPFDLNEIESAIYLMCTQPPNPASIPKRSRDVKFVKTHTTLTWAKYFLSDLKRASKDTRNYQYVTHGLGDKLKLIALSKKFTKLTPQHVLKAFKDARNRVLFFDNEGTLANYIKQAEIHKSLGPSDKILNCLDELSRDERNTVFVLTGRDRSILDRWFGQIEYLGMAAEYGAYVKWNSKQDWELVANGRGVWKETARDIIQAYVTRTEGAFMELKECSVVFQYRDADPDYGTWQAKELMSHLDILLKPFMNECEVSCGMGYVEVKPRGITKGTTVYKLMEQLSAKKGPIDFILTVGDDISDEEMFKAVKMIFKEENPSITSKSLCKSFCCTVGRKPSQAEYYINDPADLLHLLEVLKGWTEKSKKNFSYGDLNALALRHNMGNVKVCDFSDRHRFSTKKLALDVTYEAEEDDIQSPTDVFKPKRKSFTKL